MIIYGRSRGVSEAEAIVVNEMVEPTLPFSLNEQNVFKLVPQIYYI